MALCTSFLLLISSSSSNHHADVFLPLLYFDKFQHRLRFLKCHKFLYALFFWPPLISIFIWLPLWNVISFISWVHILKERSCNRVWNWVFKLVVECFRGENFVYWFCDRKSREKLTWKFLYEKLGSNPRIWKYSACPYVLLFSVFKFLLFSKNYFLVWNLIQKVLCKNLGSNPRI